MTDIKFPEPAAFLADKMPHIDLYTAYQLRKYAEEAVQAEQERCAKLCDDQARLQMETGAEEGVIAQAMRCAMVIRRPAPKRKTDNSIDGE